MAFTTYLWRLLSALRGWWQRELADIATHPPYPLTQDEWDAFLDQEEEEAQFPVAKPVAKAKSYIDERGGLVGLDLRRRAEQ